MNLCLNSEFFSLKGKAEKIKRMKTHAPVKYTVKAREALGPFLSTVSLFIPSFLSTFLASSIFSRHSLSVFRKAYWNDEHLAFGYRYGTNGSSSWSFRET